MKMVHRYIEKQINFIEGKVNVLIIENKKMFAELAGELMGQCRGENGRFVLSVGDEIVDLQKNADMLVDILNIELNARGSAAKLIAQLKEAANGESMLLRTKETESLLISYLDELADDLALPVMFNDAVDAGGLFKLFDFRLDDSGLTTITEKLLAYMRAMTSLLNKKLFIIVNLKTFVDDKELREFYTALCYDKMPLLLLENSASASPADCENIILIDSDMCEVI